jgi:hypothetical protein
MGSPGIVEAAAIGIGRERRHLLIEPGGLPRLAATGIDRRRTISARRRGERGGQRTAAAAQELELAGEAGPAPCRGRRSGE